MTESTECNEHIWYWVSRWTFQCDKCGKYGEWDGDGYVDESEDSAQMTEQIKRYECEGCKKKFETFLSWVGIHCDNCGEWVKRV